MAARLSPWKIALLVGIALAAAGVAVGAALLAEPPAAPAEAPPHEGGMDEDARCAHMPEHCAGGDAAG